jgi:putative glutamine amidotransferase
MYPGSSLHGQVHIAIPEPTSPEHVSDSAAYNLRSLPQYLHALISAGATPIPIPLHESPQRVAKILSTCHGILLPGSPADIDPQKYGQAPNGSEPPDPTRAAVDELLLQDAFNLYKPILAICQGHQALNVWRNGTLIQDIPTGIGNTVNHAPDRSVTEAHPIQITPNTRLASIYNSAHPEQPAEPHPSQLAPAILTGITLPEWVNSSHHQAILAPGDNLVVSAISPQDKVIEAVELQSPDHFVVSIQWHPERTYNASPFSRAIFQAFVHAAQSWTPRKIEESVLHA